MLSKSVIRVVVERQTGRASLMIVAITCLQLAAQYMQDHQCPDLRSSPGQSAHMPNASNMSTDRQEEPLEEPVTNRLHPSMMLDICCGSLN